MFSYTPPEERKGYIGRKERKEEKLWKCGMHCCKTEHYYPSSPLSGRGILLQKPKTQATPGKGHWLNAFQPLTWFIYQFQVFDFYFSILQLLLFFSLSRLLLFFTLFQFQAPFHLFYHLRLACEKIIDIFIEILRKSSFIFNKTVVKA